MSKASSNDLRVGRTFVFADPSSPLIVKTGTARLYNDTGRALKILSCRATAAVAPTGAALTVDVNKNGTTIYTTQGNRPSIAISGVTNKSAAPDVQAWADGEYLTVDVDQIGSTIAGGGPLTVTVVCE